MGSRRPTPDNISFPRGDNRPTPQPPRPQPPRPPITPSGPVTPATGITSPPQIDRRPPTGFFGPGKDYRVGPTGPDGQRPRRMAAAPPVVIERTTVERRTPSRPPVRDDFQPRSRDEFEGYRRGPRKEVNIAKQDI